LVFGGGGNHEVVVVSDASTNRLRSNAGCIQGIDAPLKFSLGLSERFETDFVMNFNFPFMVNGKFQILAIRRLNPKMGISLWRSQLLSAALSSNSGNQWGLSAQGIWLEGHADTDFKTSRDCRIRVSDTVLLYGGPFLSKYNMRVLCMITNQKWHIAGRGLLAQWKRPKCRGNLAIQLNTA